MESYFALAEIFAINFITVNFRDGNKMHLILSFIFNFELYFPYNWT